MNCQTLKIIFANLVFIWIAFSAQPPKSTEIPTQQRQKTSEVGKAGGDRDYGKRLNAVRDFQSLFAGTLAIMAALISATAVLIAANKSAKTALKNVREQLDQQYKTLLIQNPTPFIREIDEYEEKILKASLDLALIGAKDGMSIADSACLFCYACYGISVAAKQLRESLRLIDTFLPPYLFGATGNLENYSNQCLSNFDGLAVKKLPSQELRVLTNQFAMLDVRNGDSGWKPGTKVKSQIAPEIFRSSDSQVTEMSTQELTTVARNIDDGLSLVKGHINITNGQLRLAKRALGIIMGEPFK